MDISKFLSKAIGIYLIIVSLAMLLNMQQFIMNINGLMNDGPLLFVTGFFTLVLGVMAVVSHNIWQWTWRVFVTIFAWLTLFKGISILCCPHLLDKTTLLFIQNYTVSYGAAGLDFMLGLLFCYLGFRQSHDEKP